MAVIYLLPFLAFVHVVFGAPQPRNLSLLLSVCCSFLALVSVALGDRQGVVKAVYYYMDSLVRYPGLARFTL